MPYIPCSSALPYDLISSESVHASLCRKVSRGQVGAAYSQYGAAQGSPLMVNGVCVCVCVRGGATMELENKGVSSDILL